MLLNSGTPLPKNANHVALILTTTLKPENASAAHLDSPSTPAKPNVNALPLPPSTIPTPSNVLPAPPQESGITRATLAIALPTSPTEIPPLETVDLAQLLLLSGILKNVLDVLLELTTTQLVDVVVLVLQD